MSQEKHIMVDIEALSTQGNGVITNVGIVLFQPLRQKILSTHYYKLAWEEQCTEHGRHISKDTLAWWFKQAPAAQNEVISKDGAIPVSLFLEEFKGLCGNISKAWAKSPGFDYTMLESLWSDYRTDSFPIAFRKLVDLRTIIWLMEAKGMEVPKMSTQEVAHNALDDAVFQVEVLFMYLKEKAQ